MKDRVDPTPRMVDPTSAASRQQHRIAIDKVGRDSPRANFSLSPLSPTLSEANSASSLSPGRSSRQYARKEKIGQGAQGSVYRCVEAATGTELAVKIIMTHELSVMEIEAIKREVKTIKKLHHAHLVSYYKATERKTKQLSIYMEYVAGGSLSARLRHGGALALAMTKTYTRQLCEALRNLHENRIAHRDIKCANIFLTSSSASIKLGDFGAFKEVGSVSLVGGLKGTPHWMAPEVIRADQHTSEDGWFKADIWSLGCTVVEMLTGHSPWQQYSNPLAAMYQIVSSDKTPTIPADATEETASFLSLCLQRNPDERASIQKLLQHPFVQIPVDDLTHRESLSSTKQRRQQTSETHKDTDGNQPESTAPMAKISKSQSQRRGRDAEQPEQQPQDASPVKEARSEDGQPHPLKPAIDSPHPPSSTRGSLRKPAIIPRLKPLGLVHSPSNQEKEILQGRGDQPMLPTTLSKPLAIARGVSAGVLGPPMPSLDANSKPSTHSIPVRRVRLRRLSTAPAPSRETEDLLSCLPPIQKLKLPPLSARPATGSCSSLR